jgi:hypothetical protein
MPIILINKPLRKLADFKAKNWEEHVNFLWGNFKISDCQ